MAESGIRNMCLVQCDKVFSRPTDFRTHHTNKRRVNRAMLPYYESSISHPKWIKAVFDEFVEQLFFQLQIGVGRRA